jgi:hypothetical protein
VIAAFIILISIIYVRSSNKRKIVENNKKPTANNIEKLKELEELKKSNLISETEFEEKRNKILKNI